MARATSRPDGAPQGSRAVSGPIVKPEVVRLPDLATIFSTRAQRFAALAADGPPLAPYLRFLSHLAQVQHDGLAALPPPAVAPGPTLRREDILAADDLSACLDWMIDRGDVAETPAATREARARLAAMPVDTRMALAGAVFDGACPPDRLAEGVYVAAALQLHASRAASRLDSAALEIGGSRCPACAGPPVASVIVGWPGASRARYCCCGICGTMWNLVRAQCTCCGSGEELTYASIEGSADDVSAETCDRCNTYIKHFRQDRDPAIDPLADDVATLGLDLKVQAAGIRRQAANPLMVISRD